MASGVVALIRIEAIWLATEPLDMRAGTDTVLARVVKVFGAARPHHAYLFVSGRESAPIEQIRTAQAVPSSTAAGFHNHRRSGRAEAP